MKKRRLLSATATALTIILAVSCSPQQSNNTNSGTSTQQRSTESEISNETTSTAENNETSNFNKTGLPILNEPETFSITVRTNPNSKNTYPEKQAVIDAERDTNVHIEWREIPDSSWAEKINLMFTSGDLTDAIWGDVSVSNYSEFLLPLEGYIDEYAPYIRDLFNQYPSFEKALQMPPHNLIYGLPSKSVVPWGNIADLPFINVTWLENLGLEMPTNLDELYDVLVAFKTKDPNGNGIADEIPLSFQQGWGTSIDSLFGWFGTLASGEHIRVENDTVIFTPAEDAYYNALVYFNKLYNEGLLDKEGFSQTLDQYFAAARQDTLIYGAHISAFTTYIAGTNSDHYDVIPAFEGTIWNVTGPANNARPSVLITTECAQPEVLMRYFDYCNSTMEIALTWNMGPKGQAFELTDDGTQFYSILADTAPEGMTVDQWRYIIGTGGRSASIEIAEQRVINPTDDSEVRLRNQQSYLAVAPSQFRPYGLSSIENEGIRGDLATDIGTYIANFKATSIINGIDEAKWQEHLNTLNALRIDEYVAAWQEFYDIKK